MTSEDDKPDILYRCSAVHSGIYDVQLFFDEYRVVKRTRCGYWIRRQTRWSTGKPQWKSSKAENRFAHATKEEALLHFVHRKRKEKHILQGRIHSVNSQAAKALCIARQLFDKDTISAVDSCVSLIVGGDGEFDL